MSVKRKPLWRIAVRTSAEAEDAVGELLSNQLSLPAFSYTDVRTGETRVAVYADTRAADWSMERRELLEGLRKIRASGLKGVPARISVRRIRGEDWAESWKRHFRPMEIGKVLLCRPSWSRQRTRKGQKVIVLDPGLSFGTGHHPTTEFCLRQLVALRQSGLSQSMLDIGTGSGILAIAAAKVGYAPVDALDLDPEAIRVGRANARINGVADRICLVQRDLSRLPLRPARQYDVICANLVAELLLAEQRRIVRQLRYDGALVVAGILQREFGPLRTAYEALGLQLWVSKIDGEWASGLFGSRARVLGVSGAPHHRSRIF